MRTMKIENIKNKVRYWLDEINEKVFTSLILVYAFAEEERNLRYLESETD